MNFEKFSFQDVENIKWMLLVLVLLLLFLVYFFLKQKKIKKLLSFETFKSMLRFYVKGFEIAKVLIFFLAMILIVLALMRPQYDIKKDIEVKDTGIDISILLDISKSMKVKDVVPDRLSASKLEIMKFLDELKGGRVSLIPFAGIPFVQCPYTSDFGAVKQYLEELDVTDMPVGGTAIGRALKLVYDRITNGMKGYKGSKYKAVILFTDGENLESDPVSIAKEFKKIGLKLYTVGIGTGFGKPVPMLDADGKIVGYMRGPDNQPVISGLNEKLLKQLAKITGGKYFHYTGVSIAKDLYKEINKLEKYEYKDKIAGLKEERFQLFLIPAIILLFIEMLIPGRKRIKI